MTLKLACLGDPVTDILVNLNQEAFNELNIAEGGCVAIEPSDFRSLLKAVTSVQLPKKSVSSA